jgi:hypothetical protein
VVYVSPATGSMMISEFVLGDEVRKREVILFPQETGEGFASLFLPSISVSQYPLHMFLAEP